MKEKVASIVKAQEYNPADIPKMFRMLADEIERGERKVECALVLLESDITKPPYYMCWGQNRPIPHLMGLLYAVIHRLSITGDENEKAR